MWSSVHLSGLDGLGEQQVGYERLLGRVHRLQLHRLHVHPGGGRIIFEIRRLKSNLFSPNVAIILTHFRQRHLILSKEPKNGLN